MPSLLLKIYEMQKNGMLMIMTYAPFHNTYKKSKALRIKKKPTNFTVIHNYTIHNLHFAYLLFYLLYICLYIYIYIHILLDEKMTKEKKQNTFQ